MSDRRPLAVDYLVGGLRISLTDASTTPGPRSHVAGTVSALAALGVPVRVFLAGAQPLMSRFAALPAGSGGGSVLGDVTRVLAGVWSLCRVALWSRPSRATVVYERAAVLQSLGLAHRRRRTAVYVVECNGILCRETARDRGALGRAAPLAAAVERLTYRRADLVVVVSGALRAELRAFAGVPEDRVLVVPNAVPALALALPRPARPAAPTVGFAGSLAAWQRVDLLLRAVAQVPGVRVEVLGEGPQLAALRALADALGLAPRVCFAG